MARPIGELGRRIIEVDRNLVAQTGEIPEGLQLLSDVMPLEIVEQKDNVISEAAGTKGLPVMQITGIFQRFDQKNANGRLYTEPILRAAVDAIQEDLKSRRVMGELDHPCWLINEKSGEKLNVLTIDGWKEIRDVRIGDKVFSRVGGQMVESRVNGIVNEPYEGLTYHLKGRNIDSVFTPNHKFIMLRRPDRGNVDEIYAKAEEIYKDREGFSHSPIPRTAQWFGDVLETVKVPGLNPDQAGKPGLDKDLIFDAVKFAGFLGLYLAEGCLADHGIMISQVSEPGKAAVRKFLSELHPELHWSEWKRGGFYVGDRRLYNYLKPLGNKYSKYIPRDVKQMSSECLASLLRWFAFGDGRMLKADEPMEASSYHSCKSAFLENGGIAIAEPSVDLGKYSRLSMFTVSKRLIDDLHECLVKTGECGKLSTIVTDKDYAFADRIIKASNKVPLYQLSVSRSTNVFLDPRFTAMTQARRSGRILCLTTEHGNFYAEHRGHSFWTGNCDAKIHTDRVSHLVTRVWMEGPLVYGQAEILHKLPCGEMLKGLFEHKVQMGISSRGIGDMEVKEDEDGSETYVVQDGYRFVTWDAVAEPSVPGGTLMVMESRQRVRKAAAVAKRQHEQRLLEEIRKML